MILLKTFKRNCFSDTTFIVTVYNKESNSYDEFIVDYSKTEGHNVDRMNALYDQKAKLKNVSYNKAYELNEIWVEV
jgi:hypothetical protein